MVDRGLALLEHGVELRSLGYCSGETIEDETDHQHDRLLHLPALCRPVPRTINLTR